MRSLLLSLITCLTFISTTHAPSPAYDATAFKIQEMFNRAQYDSIWQLFSKDMQSHVSAEKIREFFGGINNQFGNIEKTTYDHKKEQVATYKLTFDRGVMALNFALDKSQMIGGLTITPFAPTNLPTMERNKTSMMLPFNGEWTVVWGGDTREQNHHINVPAQKNAFDIVITDDKGNSYKTDGKANEDYYAFGQPLIAPCDAIVMQAVDGIKDNKPGESNPIYVPGNSLMLKAANGEYMLIAHFKQHTIKVKEGDKVKQGQVLGACGNSGNSSEPHLHFHLENVENMNDATGIKCYFESIVVSGTAKTDYSPVKGDKVKNVKK